MTKEITCLEDIQELPEPLSQKFFEDYKEKILAYAPLISRVELCKITLLKRNTLRNLDAMGIGIKNPHRNPFNNQTCYEVEEVIAFLKEIYCDRPQYRIDKAYEELKKYEEEQRKKQEKFKNLYKE